MSSGGTGGGGGIIIHNNSQVRSIAKSDLAAIIALMSDGSVKDMLQEILDSTPD